MQHVTKRLPQSRFSLLANQSRAYFGRCRWHPNWKCVCVRGGGVFAFRGQKAQRSVYLAFGLLKRTNVLHDSSKPDGTKLTNGKWAFYCESLNEKWEIFYSPDLTLCDLYIFGPMKGELLKWPYNSDDEVKALVQECFLGIRQELFTEGLKNLCYASTKLLNKAVTMSKSSFRVKVWCTNEIVIKFIFFYQTVQLTSRLALALKAGPGRSRVWFQTLPNTHGTRACEIFGSEYPVLGR